MRVAVLRGARKDSGASTDDTKEFYTATTCTRRCRLSGGGEGGSRDDVSCGSRCAATSTAHFAWCTEDSGVSTDDTKKFYPAATGTTRCRLRGGGEGTRARAAAGSREEHAVPAGIAQRRGRLHEDLPRFCENVGGRTNRRRPGGEGGRLEGHGDFRRRRYEYSKPAGSQDQRFVSLDLL